MTSIQTFNRIIKLLDELFYKEVTKFSGDSERITIYLDSYLDVDDIVELKEAITAIDLDCVIFNNSLSMLCEIVIYL